MSRVRIAFEAALGAAWVAFVIHAFVPVGGWIDSAFTNGVYYALIIAASAGCLIRASAQRRNRWAWASIGTGLAVWTVGDIYYLLVLQDLAVTPVPSLADAFYLAYFPFIYTGVVLLMRERVEGATRALWLDGITAALDGLCRRELAPPQPPADGRGRLGARYRDQSLVPTRGRGAPRVAHSARRCSAVPARTVRR